MSNTQEKFPCAFHAVYVEISERENLLKPIYRKPVKNDRIRPYR